jgi:hypothetical protein
MSRVQVALFLILLFLPIVLTSGCLSRSLGLYGPNIVEKGNWGTVENISIKVTSVNAPLNRYNFPMFENIRVIIINNRLQEITISSENFVLRDNSGFSEIPVNFIPVVIQSKDSKEFDLKFDPNRQIFHNYPEFDFFPDGGRIGPKYIPLNVS